MNDKQAIDYLRKRLDPDGGSTQTAKALGVISQVITNWRTRGINPARRYDVWMLLNQHDAALDVSWIKAKTKKAA